jgi:hypothetical protein
MASLANFRTLVDFITFDQPLIDVRLSNFFGALELFKFKQASNILGAPVEPHKKKRWAEIATPFSLFAVCEKLYYQRAFLQDQTVDTLYQEVFKALQALLDVNEGETDYEETVHFCNLLREVCCIMQIRGSMILIYRALATKDPYTINFVEFAAAARSLSKRPVKCSHPYLQRVKTNTSSEIELFCRLFSAQDAISTYQLKDTIVLLDQCKSLLVGWQRSVERGTASFVAKLDQKGLRASKKSSAAAMAAPSGGAPSAEGNSFGFWAGFGSNPSVSRAGASTKTNTNFVLPPVFPWLEAYLDTLVAKACLFFNTILCESIQPEAFLTSGHGIDSSVGARSNSVSSEDGLSRAIPNPMKRTCLDVVGLGDTLIRKCRDAGIGITIGLALSVTSLRRDQTFSLDRGYVCPEYEVTIEAKKTGMADEAGGPQGTSAQSSLEDDQPEEGRTKPQGLKAWPLIYAQPSGSAGHFEFHWPNIVSLLTGGLDELHGYKKPFFHHEPNLLNEKYSYYIANIDPNVALIVLSKSPHSSPVRFVTDFFATVCPVLRTERVLKGLRPAKGAVKMK